VFRPSHCNHCWRSEAHCFFDKKIIKSTDKNAETKEETDSQKEQNEDS
jgi:hypothetical protein